LLVEPPRISIQRESNVSRLLAPGEEIVPSKKPVVTPVARSTTRSAVKFALALPKRRVPPSRQWVAVEADIDGRPSSSGASSWHPR
jgi:hypothetical protein